MVAPPCEMGRGIAVLYPSPTMNKLLVRRPIDAWAATISKQNG